MPVSPNIIAALTEPCDRRKTFLGWDAAKGSDPRRIALCSRLRAKVHDALGPDGKFKAVMRHQSYHRLLDDDPESIKQLVDVIAEWERLHEKGDDIWWQQTKEPMLIRSDALRYSVPIADDATEVENPWYQSPEEPNCHADYDIFPVAEGPTAEAFGIALEIETLAKWVGSIIESGSKAMNTGRCTKSLVYSYTRRLEGLKELLKAYPDSTPRKDEVEELCITAYDVTEQCAEMLAK